jgi:YgiT-type zinc finger domain-containing protein
MSDQTCIYCSGTLTQQRVTRLQRYEGHWFVIENLPAFVCDQCGETYFTPDAHDLVVDVITGGTPPTRTESIDVFDAALKAG